jgi:Flp pilus assembly protein TadD
MTIHPSPIPARRTARIAVIAGTGEAGSIRSMTSSAMRGFRRGMLLAATGISFAAGAAFAQDVDDPQPEPQYSRTPPGAVVQPLDTGPGAELRRNLTTLAENPRSLEALIGAGRAAIGLGDGEAATGFFTRAQQIAPDDPRVRAGLGSANLLSGRPEQALILFTEAAQRGAPEAELAGDRGLAYDMVGDPRHAQQDYALALRHRRDPEIERRFALSLAISGQRDAALRVIDSQLRRNDRAAWRTQTFILALTGDPAGADDLARRLMPPTNAQAMAPFFARLATLSPAQKAAAVNFGIFPSDGRAGRMAANVDTRPDPGALAFAQGGPPPRTPPLAEPLNGARRRPGAAAEPGYGRPQPVAPAVQPSRRTEVAQARTPRFGTTPPDQDDNADDGSDADRAAQERRPAPPPAGRREAPAFGPGANLTLDRSREEARPEPPLQPAQPSLPAATPGFGAVGQVQSLPGRTYPPAAAQPFQLQPSPMSEVVSTVRALPNEQGAAAVPVPVQPPLGSAERLSRDAAARAAEARYRSQGSTAAAEAGAAANAMRQWVQIAHGTQRGPLAGHYREVRARAPALVDGRTAWTVDDNGINRLLLGPFASEREASDYIAQLDRQHVVAVPWTSAPGQPVERLQGGGGASSAHARSERTESRPAAPTRSARTRQAEEHAAASDDRGSSRRSSARDRDSSDERGSSRSRAGRDRDESNARGNSHGRSGRDRDEPDARSNAHGRSARDRAESDDRNARNSSRNSSHGRSGRDRDDADDNARGRGNARHRADDDSRDSSRSRNAHGRANPRDESRSSSSSRSSQERRPAHDTRTSRSRSGEEQRPAPSRRRSGH